MQERERRIQTQERVPPPAFRSLAALNDFYTEQGDLRPELLDEISRGLGEAFARGEHHVSSTQIRRFYSDVKDLQQKIGGDLGERMKSDNPEDLQQYLALVKMLKAKVAYATRREAGERVSRLFKDTIDKCVDLIRMPKDFQAFALFLECIIGYYYGAGGR